MGNALRTFRNYVKGYDAGITLTQLVVDNYRTHGTNSPRALSLPRGAQINWFGEVKATPKVKLFPNTLKRLRSAIRVSNSKGQKLRVCGALHSESSLFAGPHVALYTMKLESLLDVDASNGRIRVETGMSIYELLCFADLLGLTFPSTPDDLGASVGGALATGAHGGGFGVNSFVSCVLALDIIDAAGNLKHITRDSISGITRETLAGLGLTPEDVFDATLVGLGVCGVVYAVTLQAQETQNLNSVTVKTNLKDVCSTYARDAREHRHYEFVWDVPSDDVLTVTHDIARADENRGLAALRYRITSYVSSAISSTVAAFRARVWARNEEPHADADAPVLRLTQSESGDASEDASKQQQQLPCMPGYLALRKNTARALAPSFADSTSVAPPREDVLSIEIAIEWTQLDSALKTVKTLLCEQPRHALENEDAHPPRLDLLAGRYAVCVRFVGDESALLSPAHGRNSAYIEVFLKRCEAGDELARLLEAALARQHGGRPSWSRTNHLNATDTRVLFGGHNVDAFLRVAALFDPKRRLWNNHIAQRLGDQ